MDDVLIVGSGVIGLSIAYELAQRGLQVRVVDRGAIGQEASWAGAGILPPSANPATSRDAYSALHGLSMELHPQWAERLRSESGIDNGLRRCGAIYVARSASDAEQLDLALAHWHAEGLRAEQLAEGELRTLEPRLAADGLARAVHLPDECQLRNPWHLRALATACRQRGVAFEEGVAIEAFERKGSRIMAAVAADGGREAGAFCIAAGSWTGRLESALGIGIPVRPVLGQILLLKAEPGLLTRIVNEGPRYLVPREDGHVLVGSTEEEVGFEKRTTVAGIAGLLKLAVELVPALATAGYERSWSGLRPATVDGMPFLGPAPGLENVCVAAGHFRSGLTLSPGTAVAISDLLTGQRPAVDLRAFRLDRA